MEWRDLHGIPDGVIEKWIGHRPEVAKKHYDQLVADEAYERYPIGPKAARQKAQQASEMIGTDQNRAGALLGSAALLMKA